MGWTITSPSDASAVWESLPVFSVNGLRGFTCLAALVSVSSIWTVARGSPVFRLGTYSYPNAASSSAMMSFIISIPDPSMFSLQGGIRNAEVLASTTWVLTVIER